jgi:Entner-Doudoroff aldolase
VSDFIQARLAASPVIAILRGHRADDAVRVAERCWAAGVELVEVSLAADGAAEALRAVCTRGRELGRTAGAGTVLDPDDVATGAAAGAAFLIAPGLDPRAVVAARRRGLPMVPGAATPSEVQRAVALGCSTVKVFPAAALGPAWITALRAPYPDVRLVAVGGISSANARVFLDAGAAGVGIGSALEPEALGALVGELRPGAA